MISIVDQDRLEIENLGLFGQVGFAENGAQTLAIAREPKQRAS
jgi:hypothetical protein